MSNDNFKKMTDVYQVLSKQHEPQSLALSYQPITYEKSIFKQMADDVKSPFEAQLETLQSIADSAEKQLLKSKLNLQRKLLSVPKKKLNPQNEKPFSPKLLP